MDLSWWQMYANDVQKVFIGARFSNNKQNPRYGVTHIANFDAYGNSGAASIALAAKSGAKKIILLGYDCQKTDGKAHWHGDHPAGLGNAKAIDKWQAKFERLANDLKDVQIINASRATALDMFQKMDLENALA
jgi:uncharacterized Rossmann fold enzyme